MTEQHPTIKRFFAAMQTGATAEGEMMSLFADDAVYREPFSGRDREHRGKAAIRQAMAEGWETPLPDMRIEIDRLQVTGELVRVQWTCHSPALPGGKGSGENIFTLRDGMIARLETHLLMG